MVLCFHFGMSDRRRMCVVTGTPGTGKSILRSYFAYRRLQEALTNAEWCAIWMSRSPASTAELIEIKDGKIRQYKSLRTTDDYKIVNDYLTELSIPLYSFVDVSSGDSFNVLPEWDLHRRCFFTSPDERAWKEKRKYSGSVFCVPVWSTEELVSYYLTLAKSDKVMLEKVEEHVIKQVRNNEPIPYQLGFISVDDTDSTKIILNPLQVDSDRIAISVERLSVQLFLVKVTSMVIMFLAICSWKASKLSITRIEWARQLRAARKLYKPLIHQQRRPTSSIACCRSIRRRLIATHTISVVRE